MKKKQTYIFGASGHGKVVASTLISAGYEVAGFFDDNPDLHGTEFFGLLVLGGQDAFSKLNRPAAVMAIGNGAIRKKIVEKFSEVDWIRAIHAKAWVDRSVKVGQGTVIFAGAVIQPDATVGEHCIINTGATVDHDCRIGDFVHICPGVNLAGNVTVGKGAWIGIGSQVIQGVSIGEGSVIGAGSTVIRDVPDGATVVGTPAKPNRMENGDRRTEDG